ncbi:hydantoinase/oxoprolinase family protein [Defluviimonas sp. WL0002]|uniref:Hydantoinase/oxoprolinase family protein n=1 Tax=Albidovulum marisflavi TaxID=2984159 RepID=A0ABT2Z982_9RHOB|nr:hydantoinase/oxoprolinase family protein [Defluviimonas sp. WL0002]MCV2867699.1 hydantoinase/oxoprolinase family protein [Defluviimonas sp. WL0002]
MAYLLGVDTGGTYTDAVILNEAEDRVIASAKSLTTRPDLSLGVGRAIDAALGQAGIDASQVGMVSLSTTLATNALVEGQGGRVALIFIGFEAAELARAGLEEAMKGDPVVRIAGGHNHAGAEATALDMVAVEAAALRLGPEVTGFAVASAFATRNPAHEIAARDAIRSLAHRPVTCSHELSAGLNGPRRALTAVLNARLIGMIDGLITACEAHMAARGIIAPLMVVRGDGALVSSNLARERPIETILSGPAASIAGASWLSGETEALVSDIGGTTTDVCLLQDGKPKIDPLGARVGPYRTMVEAVAMRTTGLGGDSEVHLIDGLETSLRLGPRRLMPLSLAARDWPELVHGALDSWLGTDMASEQDGRFAIPMWKDGPPAGLAPREAAVAERLLAGPMRVVDAVRTRLEFPALMKLVSRGAVMIAGVTPSDAAHVLGRLDSWDADAARKGLTLFARRRNGRGDRIAPAPEALAGRIVDQLTQQTVECLLEAAFAEDGAAWPQEAPEVLARHALTRAAFAVHSGVVRLNASLGVPVIGLGASAPSYYGAVGERVGARMILPEHAGVANAIGAVVGQIAMHSEGIVTSPGPGIFSAHLPAGPARFADQSAAIAALEAALSEEATSRARASGVEELRLTVDRDIREIEIEGQPMFIEARLRVTAQGRPRIAVG